LILSNHQSFLDPVVIGLTSPRKARFAARTSLFRFAPLGFYLTALGGIRLNRDGVATSGIKESLRILSADDALVYFPEGTRTPDGAMLPFRKGVGLVLRRATASVVFCGIAGAYDLWPRELKFPAPGDVWVHYRLWRPPRNWKSLDEDALTALLEREVRATVEEARRRLAAFSRSRRAATPGP
jgi:1-acyl-sn-glycerol-3-phosphate acyltransferase